MSRRPIYVTIIAWLFILMGAIALVGGFMDIYNSMKGPPVRNSILELLIMCFTRVVGLAAGIFLLKGKNWARWLCLFWMTFHIGLSIMHLKIPELVMHGVFLLVLIFFLFRPRANEYFAG